MRVPIPNFIRWYPIMSLILLGTFSALITFIYNYYKVDNYIPVTLTGVQHMGSDYRIADFYVDKYNGGTVGESGGGGSRVCCLMLPRKWHPGLKANVRWEVRHIIRPSDPALPETEEVAGLYHAQVPVEAYDEPEKFWVHFFPQGGVRIVVSPFGPYGEQHPIQFGDTQAVQQATVGFAVKALFSPEEIVELERQHARDNKMFGGWR